MTRRKICVVTTRRAEFGLLLAIMQSIRNDSALRLQVVVAGMHLAPKFGLTLREIEAEGIRPDWKIDMHLAGDSELANVKSISLGMNGFAEAFTKLKPAIVVLLGDRFELLGAAVAALMLRIPIAHIHGGERTEGAIDESVRHAITKMASLHFAATEPISLSTIQMGESPARVFNFGAPGLDRVHGLTLMTRAELEKETGLCFDEPVALVTYHPVTLEQGGVEIQVRQLLAALRQCGIKAILTMANADAQGRLINERLGAFCAQAPERFKWIPHLGHRRYLSCLRHCAVMIGNSSSGLTEAPSFRLPVVNIGDRQRGRIRAANVNDVRRSRAEMPCAASSGRVLPGSGTRSKVCATHMIAITTGEPVSGSKMS